MRPMRQLALFASLAAVASVVTAGSVSAATAAPAFGYGTPTFLTSAAPSSFSGATVSGEPSIGVDWKTGAAMYMGGTSTARLTFNNNANPPAVTWTDVSSPYSDINLDPILATEPHTGTTIAGGDDGPCAVMSVTTNDGGFLDPTSWTPSAPCPFAADHPTVGMGPYAGTPPVNATAPFVSYFCQQSDVDSCSHSVDGGLTWSPSVPDTNFTCLSLFGHVKVSADGTAYVPSANCFDADNNSEVGAIVSKDNGQSLTGLAIPNAPTPADGFDPSVATDDTNRVYESWSRAGDYHPVVTWSDNHGGSWAPQVDLANTVSPALTAATFESAVAGDSGRAAVAYLGTWAGTPGDDPFTTGFHGVWYLFVSYTYDGGQTWQTVQASPDPVQRGEIDAGGTTTSGQRNLLDFMDASLTKDGRVVVGYADGCLDVCNGPNGTEKQSTNQYATVAYQGSGEGLFSAYDVTPVTAPLAPALSASATASAINLGWTVPSDGGSAISGYQVLRGTSPSAESVLTTLPATATSYVDSTATPGTAYYYRVAALNSIGTGDPSNEVSSTLSTTPAAPTASAADGNGKVALAWSAPANGGSPITGYRIYRGLAPGTETAYASVGAVTSYADSAVTVGTTYYYTVAATNAVGTGSPSPETAATPTTVPSAATLTGTAGKSQVSLSWTTPASGGAPITGWAIYRGTSSGAEQLVQTISSGTSYVDNTVTGGTTYYYEVAAINRNGTGALSREVSVTPKKAR
jgi:fibronectin type 3 domain-containing protein